ncbi:hypothetical protein MASR1M74_05070 [Lentimicrobium sp.]
MHGHEYANTTLSIKASHTVEVELSGPDPAVLRELSTRTKEIFKNNPYADPYTIEDDWEPMGEALVTDYMQQAAARAGASRSDANAPPCLQPVRLPIGECFEGRTGADIVMKLRNADGSAIQNLDDIPVGAYCQYFR